LLVVALSQRISKRVACTDRCAEDSARYSPITYLKTGAACAEANRGLARRERRAFPSDGVIGLDHDCLALIADREFRSSSNRAH
jgi:hypothetical protein